MKLIQKFILGFLGIALLMGVVGAVQVLFIFDISSDLNQIDLSNTGELEGSIKIAHRVTAISADNRQYLPETVSPGGGSDPEIRHRIEKNLAQLDSDIAVLKSATETGKDLAETEEDEIGEASELNKISELTDLLTGYKNLISGTIEIAEKQDTREAIRFFSRNTTRVEKEVRIISRDLFNDALGEISDEVGEIDEATQMAAIITGSFTLAAFLIAIIIGVLVSRRLAGRINRLKWATRDIQQGDWDVRIPTTKLHDEIDELALSFNEMARNLKASTASIKELNRQILKREDAEAALQNAHDKLEIRVKQRTRELEHAKIEAETASRTKSKFLAQMSHELRTPLNHIIGFTQLIVDEKFGGINDMQKEYLNDVLSSSSHLLQLINDILDLSKIEAGKMELKLSNVHVPTLLNNCLTMFKENALKQHIDLVLEAATVLETLQVDEIKLKQILYNLMSNAFKFTPDGGRIIVKAWQLGAEIGHHPVSLELPAKGIEPNMWAIAVTDNGIGVPPQELETIFNPFEQSSNQKTNATTGTGLGLALTRKMVELHGGVIQAHSDGPDQGTTFTIVFPRFDKIHPNPNATSETVNGVPVLNLA